MEERDVKLNAEYIALHEKKSSGAQERLNVKDLEEKIHILEAQMGEIENENKGLQKKIDNTNVSIGSFVSEMNFLLEQHDIQNAQNMDVESGHDYEDDEEEDEYLDEEDTT